MLLCMRWKCRSKPFGHIPLCDICRVAWPFERGPIVYCLEGVDHGNIALDRIALDPQQILSGEFEVEYVDNLLNGICVLHGQGTLVDEDGWDRTLYRHKRPSSKPVDIMAIPYYVWANRDPGEMRIWFRELP